MTLAMSSATTDTLPPRLASKVLGVPSGCWEWQAFRNPKGYGRAYYEGRMLQAHRVIYELLVGPIADGLQLDHLCRNPCCVNPAHLEPVTSRENTLRGTSPSAQAATRTHCPAGHAYDAANTLFYKGGRGCRSCKRIRDAKLRQCPTCGRWMTRRGLAKHVHTARLVSAQRILGQSQGAS